MKTEAGRLKWFRFHQKEIRADMYKGVQDAMHLGDASGSAAGIGTRVILPSGFTGSPRYMHGAFQDAMAIVQTYGKPDLFITMTCNPDWPEVKAALLPGQHANDRPDVLARVFHLKLQALLLDLTKRHCMGRVIAHIHVVEFQKRGLPHAHILLILGPEDKLHTPDDYDKLISAELPDVLVDPALHKAVCEFMMHGPCGALNAASPCMSEGVCTKKWPRKFQATTMDSDDGYPLYRRRDNGVTGEVKRGFKKFKVCTDGVRNRLRQPW